MIEGRMLEKNPIPGLVHMDMSTLRHFDHVHDGDVVYLVHSSGCIKIGKTSGRAMYTRIVGIQVGNPHSVHLIAWAPGGTALERQLHDRFAERRYSQGEWFELTIINEMPECFTIWPCGYWCMLVEHGRHDDAKKLLEITMGAMQ